MIESYRLTPKLVGDRIGLPMAVIFSVLAGGQLFSFLGMLLALPVAAVANVLLRYAHEHFHPQPPPVRGRTSAIVAGGSVGDRTPPA